MANPPDRKRKKRADRPTLFDDCKSLEEHRSVLLRHLYAAMQIEHGTIPPYLCALYSIKDGTNDMPAQRIRSVVVEEMLHMALVANLTNAVGGRPDLLQDDFILDYPGPLPQSDGRITVSLNRFSMDAVNLFLDIERPEMEPDENENRRKKEQTDSISFSSIGEFYAVIKDEFDLLREKYPKDDVFTGDPDRQVTALDYYSGGGEIIPVECFDSAKLAIKVIVDEGEGFGHTIFSGDNEHFGEERDLSHFFKFNEIAVGRSYMPDDSPDRDPTGPPVAVDFSPDAVYPAKFYNKVEDYPNDVNDVGPELKELNRTYSRLLRALHEAFNEKLPEKDGASKHLQDAVGLMYEVKRRMIRLMKIPIDERGNTAGPTFKYVKE